VHLFLKILKKIKTQLSANANYEGVIYHGDGSPPSEAHGGGWEGLGKDGGEPSMHFSIRLDISHLIERCLS